jgi:hypothetical protein
MEGLLLPGYVTSIRSLKDGSVVLSVETQELSPMKAGEVFSLRGKLLAMYLSAKDTITQRELDQVDKVQIDMPGNGLGISCTASGKFSRKGLKPLSSSTWLSKNSILRR